MPCVWIFSPYKLSHFCTHTHAIKGANTHQMLSNGTEMKENFIREGGGRSRMGVGQKGTRSIGKLKNKEGLRTNLRALRSLCGRLASGGSRRFRDT